MQIPPAAEDAEFALQGLRRLVQGIRTTSYTVERKFGITGAQLFVLRELALEPGASIRRLADRTLTDPSSVSVVVGRLVARGLVARTRDTTDGRKSSLLVSKKGATLLARAPEPYQNRIVAVLRELPKARLRMLGDALGQLADALELEHAEAPLFFEAAARSQKAPTKKRKTRVRR